MLFFTRLCSEVKYCGLVFTAMFIMLAGCDSQAEQERQILLEQVNLLQNQVKGWQAHYRQLLCAQDALAAVESLDMALDAGLDLASYQQKIAAAEAALKGLECQEAGQPLLMAIMSRHRLAARVWQARASSQADGMAEEFIQQIYPLWEKFSHPWPPFVTPELRQLMAEYGQASGPEARQTLKRITWLWQDPHTMDSLAAIANQLLWHEAHNQLRDYKTWLLTPPYPTR